MQNHPIPCEKPQVFASSDEIRAKALEMELYALNMYDSVGNPPTHPSQVAWATLQFIDGTNMHITAELFHSEAFNRTSFRLRPSRFDA